MDLFRLADSNLQRNEAILWNRTKLNDKLIYSAHSEIENILLTDPMAVTFGPELSLNLISPNYPCKYVSTSNSIFRVM